MPRSIPSRIRSPAPKVLDEPRPRLSLYDLVRAQEDRLRNGEAEFLRGFQVDAEVELDRLLHRKLARLRALQDLVDVSRGAPDHVGRVRAEGEQRTGRGEAIGWGREHGREAMLLRGLDDPAAVREEETFD